MKITTIVLLLGLLAMPMLSSAYTEDIGNGNIHTIVWQDSDENGIRENEPGISGVAAWLFNDNWDQVREGVTDTKGNIFFNQLTPGEYYVCFNKQTFPENSTITLQNAGSDDQDSDAFSDGCSEFIIVEPNAYVSTEIGLIPNGLAQLNSSIKSFVWDDTNMNGLQDSGEEGIAGVEAWLYDRYWNWISEEKTGNDGVLNFTDLMPDHYHVCFSKEDFPVDSVITLQNIGRNDKIDSDAFKDGCTDLITVTEGHVSTSDLGLYTETEEELPGSLNTFVWIDTNMDGLQDNRESGLPNIGAWIFDSNWNYVDRGVTNNNGVLNFTDLRSGGYHVCFNKETFPANSVITLRNTGSNDMIDSDTFDDACTELITVSAGQAANGDLGLYALNNLKVAYCNYHHGNAHRGSLHIREFSEEAFLDSYDVYDGHKNFLFNVDNVPVEFGVRHFGRKIFTQGLRGLEFGTHQRRWTGQHNPGFEQLIRSSRYVVGIKNGLRSPMLACDLDNPITPIAFDLNLDGMIGTTGSSTARDATRNSMGKTVQFDMLGNGNPITMEWFTGDGDGILVDNRDGLAATQMNGTRLFGDQGGRFEHGYQQLALLDVNADGVLTDIEMQGLLLWVDNGDAVIQDGELQTLAAWQIASINTQMEMSNGMMRSFATMTNGQRIMTEDVWFSIAPALASTPATINKAVVIAGSLASVLALGVILVGRRRKQIATQTAEEAIVLSS